jgi:hypothetical protein
MASTRSPCDIMLVVLMRGRRCAVDHAGRRHALNGHRKSSQQDQQETPDRTHGISLLESRIVRYTLPLAVLGAAVALYHALLVWGVVPKDLVPCGQGPSCAEADVIFFGFVTFPLLSLASFMAIAVLLILVKARTRT